MKILFLNSLADPNIGGGAEEIVWAQMRGLRDAGHQCVLLATDEGGGLKRFEHEGIIVWKAGIKNSYWPYNGTRPHAMLRALWHLRDSYNPWMQGYIREVVQRERPQIASLHNLPGWSVAAWLTLRRMHVPTVQVLHDYYLLCAKASMFRSGSNCTSRCADCLALRIPHLSLSSRLSGVVGVSEFILQRHQQFGYFNGVPVQRMIHNVRDPDQLGVLAASGSHLHTGLRIGYIGRLDPLKGLDLLITAFQQADIPDSELWIAGSGKQAYEKYLRELISDPRIRLLGRQRPSDFYPQVDAVMVPSLWNDNLPSVVFEALAFGKPVIGARRGGIPEMINDGENGLLFEPDLPGDLKRVIETIAVNANRAQLTENAKRSSAPFIDIQGWISKYEKLYKKVANIDKAVQITDL